MIIYIVKSSEGHYEDYNVWNEKAFISKEKAEKYAKELDKKHRYKPEFITDLFEDFYNEGEDIFYENNPYPSFKDPDYENLRNKFEEECNKFIITHIQDNGINITPEMLKEYEEWVSDVQFYDWHDCEIEEIELVE